MNAFDVEKSVGFLLAKVHQRLFRVFRQELAPYDITPPQFALLAFLWKRDGLSQVELSELTEIDRTTIGGLIDRLEKTGWVERLPHPADRRVHHVHLTGKARGLEEELRDIALRVRSRFTARLAAGEYEKLCELLQKLRN